MASAIAAGPDIIRNKTGSVCVTCNIMRWYPGTFRSGNEPLKANMVVIITSDIVAGKIEHRQGPVILWIAANNSSLQCSDRHTNDTKTTAIA
jgi:hypothetical protein